MLVNGLPADAATFRDDGLWTREEHLLADLLERQDAWSRSLFEAIRGVKRIEVLAPITVDRPGAAKQESQGRVVSDPRELAAFFARNR